MQTSPRVTVFGGASPRPGDAVYEEALDLGQKLGSAGFTVLTGGYIGTMEAISRGAAERGGHVIGVTCDQIELWRPVKANPWVMEEMRFPTLRERLYALIDYCDAAISLPGGIGSLAEVATMWSQMQTGSTPVRPLILVGSGWRETLSAFERALDEFIPVKDRSLLSYAPDVNSAFQMVQNHFASAPGKH
jgi:uncharacterized protein (TIGR00730 family)